MMKAMLGTDAMKSLDLPAEEKRPLPLAGNIEAALPASMTGYGVQSTISSSSIVEPQAHKNSAGT
ncbi:MULTISPECIES: hypothetical protein [unclassified Rhizobacter]|uniref:hypothetical protein n=1 Tax=unclassified Rhizobacter TaxID=2640088 RepID=UPI0012FBC7C8|nr:MULTISPECIES: hypothetical protein [unclassified Rhizobacter]